MTTSGLAGLPAARRAALERAAVAEFSTAGFQQASLNAIIQAVGMSKSSFYHFIDSKADLFEQVLDSLTARAAERVRAPDPEDFAGPAFWPTTEDLVARLAELSAADADLRALGRMFYLSGAPLDLRGTRPALLARVADWLGAVLAVGRRHGAVSNALPPDLQAHLVFAVLRAMDEWSVARLEEFTPDELAELLSAQFAALRGLLDPERARGR